MIYFINDSDFCVFIDLSINRFFRRHAELFVVIVNVFTNVYILSVIYKYRLLTNNNNNNNGYF